MIYIINGFEFNSDSLVLTQAGENVEIRHNEAKLLAFLLSNAQQVVSKEQILSQVWRDKVVSEQAIFQNISHLRAIFGNAAIKTFPKRGYQWTLPMEMASATTPDDIKIGIKEGQMATLVTRGNGLTLAGIACLLLVAIVWGIIPGPKAPTDFAVATLPITGADLTLDDGDTYSVDDVSEHTSSAFLQSPEWEYAKMSDQHQVVLAADVRQKNAIYYLDFLLKGPAGEWSGVISAASEAEVAQRLQRHLEQTAVQESVALAMLPEVQMARLTIAHQENPNDLIILSYLIEAYLSMNQLDNALVMAEKLETTALAGASEPFYQAFSLLKQSAILTRKKLFEQSAIKLEEAIKGFEQVGDNRRLSDAWYANSWLRHIASDYAGVKRSLLKASELAATVPDRQREIEGLTYLSVMAHKNGHSEDKYHYLLMAEDRMKAYQLPQYHFAKIPFHYSIFADKEADKVPHWKQVLEFTRLNPDYWVAQSCRQRLLQYYLRSERIDDAKALLVGLTSDNAQNDYLRTLISLAEGNEARFVQLAQQTFEKAQLAGLNTLSLDVALLLLKQANDKVNSDFYVQFIEQNASQQWRRQNEKEWMAWSN